MLHQEYRSRLERIGPPTQTVPATADQLAYARAHLPGPHLEFLDEQGFSGFFGNGFQLCSSQEFRAIAALVFKADADFSHNDCHVTGYTAWGELACWSERHGIVRVDLLKYEIRCLSLAPNELGGPPLPTPKAKPDPTTLEVRGALQLLPFNEDDTECWSWDEKPMFADAVRDQGSLALGECFGFVPSLGMVGFNSRHRAVGNVKKFPALEHFALISQMDEFDLVRTVRGQTEVVRPIG